MGIVMYLLMMSWLIIGSVARLLIELEGAGVDWLPFTGMALGILAAGGIGFGHVTEHDLPRGPSEGSQTASDS